MTTLAPMEHGALLALTERDVLHALDAVIDPELDEPITDLGFVRSVRFTDDGLEVHLRLPTSFCAPNFAYLMASDAKDVLTALPEAGLVVVELDDHHDSDIINRGLAADAGYRGTFLHEAESDLDELRATFQRKAHTAAMERALTALLRARDDLGEQDVAQVVLGDLPDDEAKAALREGDRVKLMVVPSEGIAERLWVVVSSVGDEVLHGTFASDAVELRGLHAGDVVTFERRHVLAIRRPDA